MKIRNGFVSNSSSSSYLIAFKSSVACDHCGRSDLSITDLLSIEEGYDECEAHIRKLGIKNISDLFKEYYYIGNEDCGPETVEFIRYSKLCSLMSKAVDEGFEVAYIQIPYNDKITMKVIQGSHNIEILDGDG